MSRLDANSSLGDQIQNTGYTRPKMRNEARLPQLRVSVVFLERTHQTLPRLTLRCASAVQTARINSMRREVNKMKTVKVIKGIALSLVVCAVMFVGADSTTEAGNRCTDHCADVYKVKKDGCRLIPFKTERHICERRAKETKNDCKHRCR